MKPLLPLSWLIQIQELLNLSHRTTDNMVLVEIVKLLGHTVLVQGFVYVRFERMVFPLEVGRSFGFGCGVGCFEENCWGGRDAKKFKQSLFLTF